MASETTSDLIRALESLIAAGDADWLEAEAVQDDDMPHWFHVEVSRPDLTEQAATALAQHLNAARNLRPLLPAILAALAQRQELVP